MRAFVLCAVILACWGVVPCQGSDAYTGLNSILRRALRTVVIPTGPPVTLPVTLPNDAATQARSVSV